MKTIDFKRNNYDNCVYHNWITRRDQILPLLYVDDMLIVSKDLQQIKDIKIKLRAEFEMKDMGHAGRILGIDILRERNINQIFLSHQNYLEKVLVKYVIIVAKAVLTPLAAHFRLSSRQKPQNVEEREYMDNIPYANVVGSVVYSMVSTELDLAYDKSVLSRFMSKPGKPHWLALKSLLKYLKGSLNLALLYKRR